MNLSRKSTVSGLSSDFIFKVIVYMIVILVVLAVLLPISHIISVSMSNKIPVLRREVGLWPVGLNFDAYRVVFSEKIFVRSFFNSVFCTVTITFFALLFEIMAGYAFSREFYGKKLITYFFIIPMYFSGGMIPAYILITRYLKWTNTYYALIIPGCFMVFYMIIIRSQIEQIPPSLTDAARVDGASELRTLFAVVIPSISPTIAAVSMFTALGAWNMWFPVMIYTNRTEFWNLQYYLRTIVFDRSFMSTNVMRSVVSSNVSPINIQAAAVVLVALPIVTVYPFAQKYFTKGLLLGSVKE